MNKASIALRYVLPAAVAGGLVAFCLSLSFQKASPEREDVFEVIGGPHGQVLIAVVEPDGVYLGEDRIPIDHFGTVFDAVYRKQHLDGAMVLGTRQSRGRTDVRVVSDEFADGRKMESVDDQ